MSQIMAVALLAMFAVCVAYAVFAVPRACHRHHPAMVILTHGVEPVDAVGAWERCACGRGRMCGDRRWRRPARRKVML